MKLLRLTSNQTQAFFDNTLNQDLILNPGTQIALQSLALQVDVNQLVIDASNNGMQFQFNNSTGEVHQVFFAPGTYTLLNYNELFINMTTALNRGLSAFASSEIGYEWSVNLDPTSKKLKIITKKATAQAFSNFASTTEYMGGVNVGTLTPSSKTLERKSGTPDTNDAFVYSRLPLAKGAGTFRARNTRFGESAIVLTKEPILSTDTLIPFEKVAFGIIITTDGEGGEMFKYIYNGQVLNPTEKVSLEGNDYVCIDIVKGAVVGTVYQLNVVKVQLFSFPYDNTSDLFPSIIFRGNTPRFDLCAATPSPFYSISSVQTNSTDSVFLDVIETELTAPPKPHNQPTNKYILFNDIRLANICGFKNNRIPVDGYKIGIDETWEGDVIFSVGALNQSYTVQLLNLNIPSSYDTLSHQRNNTLATINTSMQDNTRVTYECSFPIWLDLNNANPITQRNWKARVLFEDNSIIPTIGFSQMTILIKDKNE